MIPDTLKDKTTEHILKLIDIYLDNWYPASAPPIEGKPLLLIQNYKEKIEYIPGYWDAKVKEYYSQEDYMISHICYYKYSDADKVYELLTNKKNHEPTETTTTTTGKEGI